MLIVLAVISMPAFARGRGTAETQEPSLKSQAALVVDQESGEILLGKNAQSKLPIASLTKLMTAIVTLEAELDPDEPVTITKADVDRLRGSHSRLQVGATLTRDEMLHLALMASENRAASALASSYPGGKDSCVLAMNLKAAARNDGNALRGRDRAFGPQRFHRAGPREAGAGRARVSQDPRLYDFGFLPGQDRAPRDALRQHQPADAQLALGHRPVEDRLHRRGGAVPGHAGDACRAFDYHRAARFLG